MSLSILEERPALREVPWRRTPDNPPKGVWTRMSPDYYRWLDGLAVHLNSYSLPGLMTACCQEIARQTGYRESPPRM